MTDTDSRVRPPAGSPVLKIWLSLLALSVIFWLGGITMRALIANEFFVPGTLIFNPRISLDQERTLFQLIYASSIFVLVNYAVVLLSVIAILKVIPLRMKENGWLLMAALLFFLFVPVELFTAYLDLKFIFLWDSTRNILDAEGTAVYVQHSTMMRETLSHRIGALAGLPVMATFCYFTAVLIVVWQPLRRRPATAPASDAEAHA